MFSELIASHISSEQLLTPGARVVVGLSGGADSSALLAVLCELGYECHAVHCHFGLRGTEADRDLQHSHELAISLGAQFYSVYFDTHAYMQANGISVEMACRDLRYDYFEQLKTKIGAEAIAVGHHKEDNVETFFLNLLRGSGIHGLKAMLPRRGSVVRPLLCVSKSDIAEYLKFKGIDYVDDSTNRLNDFKRNRLRNVVLPMLEEQFPGALASISESIAHLRSNELLYNSLIPVRSDSLDGVSDILLFEWLAPYGFNMQQCQQMLEAAAGAQFVTQSHRVTICSGRRYELDVLATRHERPHLTGKVYPKPANFKPEQGVLYLDASCISDGGEWELRPRRDGDRIRPFGMTHGTKLVNDVLAEAGVSVSKRNDSYVLTLNDEILWVVGVRTSANYPITKSTEKVIEIRHENSGN